jgi:acetolactate synthase-1/2/3 large subunit
LFVKALENEGVRYVFGVPGEENLDLLEALRTSKIQFITTRHEQTAGFMAATVGRLTGKAGVALSTLGPGATNLVTPAAFAELGGMPLVMITGQKPIKKSKQGHFQIVSTSDILRPVTKFTKQIVNGSSVAALVREAFRIAEEERPGAVHLELPEDVAGEEIEEIDVFEVRKVRRPVAEEKAIKQAVEMIEAAKHPLLLIGAGANRKLTSKMLREFVDATGIPFFNTQMGKGVVDERHPLYLGCAALTANDYLHCAIDRADLIINVGHDVVEKPPFVMKRGTGNGGQGTENEQQVIHVNFYSAKVDAIYFPQLEVIGDIANAVWQIKEKIKKQKHWDFSYFLRVKEKLEAHIAEKAGDDHFPVFPQKIVADVRAAMPEGGVVALDNGMYKLWFSRHYKTYEPNTLLLDNALATMGAGLASAIAARLVYPDRKILAVCGDGGFLMNAHELETAVRLKLNLSILLLNDNGYGMIQWKQDGMGFEKFGLSLGNPDWVAFAESFGARGYRARRAEDVASLLKGCLDQTGVHLIEVPVDYSENVRVFNEELKKKTCEF